MLLGCRAIRSDEHYVAMFGCLCTSIYLVFDANSCRKGSSADAWKSIIQVRSGFVLREVNLSRGRNIGGACTRFFQLRFSEVFLARSCGIRQLLGSAAKPRHSLVEHVCLLAVRGPGGV